MKFKLHNGTPVEYKTGTYGPKHDPYSFVEVSAGMCRAHFGIGCWVDVAGKTTEFGDDAAGARELFYRRTGVSFDDIVATYHAMPEDPMGSLKDYE